MESLERLGLTESEAEALVRENAAFIAGLDHVIQTGKVAERQAAVRRCMKGALIVAAHRTATIDLRIVPASAQGTGAEPSGVVRVQLA